MTRLAKTALLLIALALLGTGAGLMTDGALQQTSVSSSPNASTIFAHPFVRPLMAMAQPQPAAPTAARAAALVVAGVTPPDLQVSAAPQPGPPFPGLPPYGAIVHLKGGVCSQRASVIARRAAVGGRGILILSDPSPTTGANGYHWLTSDTSLEGKAPFGAATGRMYGHFWAKTDAGVDGRFQLSYGSSDCPAPGGNYIGNATVITITITD